MTDIPFEIPELPVRKIDELDGKNAEVTTNDGRVLIGYGRCVQSLPIDPDDDNSEEDDFLKFDLKNGESEFLRDKDISSYKVR